MKRLVLKTILITVGVFFILAVSAFGIASMCAPRAMMRLTASMGLEGVSGDYAFREYERSGDVGCLARSFLISAQRKNDRKADERFELLVADEGFEEFCEHEDQTLDVHESVAGYSYRNYVMGLEACVKYRLAQTEEEETAAIDFALSQTDASFPEDNPTVALVIECAREEDKPFCAALLARLEAGGYAGDAYHDIINILEDAINE